MQTVLGLASIAVDARPHAPGEPGTQAANPNGPSNPAVQRHPGTDTLPDPASTMIEEVNP